MINWTSLLHDNHTDVRSMILDHHYGQNMTQDMIAEHLGVGTTTLKQLAKRLNITWKQRYGRPYSRIPQTGKYNYK